MIVGCVCVGFALLFAILQLLHPRHMGDKSHIPWLANKNEAAKE